MTQMCGERIARVCVFECEREIERERERVRSGVLCCQVIGQPSKKHFSCSRTALTSSAGFSCQPTSFLHLFYDSLSLLLLLFLSPSLCLS